MYLTNSEFFIAQDGSLLSRILLSRDLFDPSKTYEHYHITVNEEQFQPYFLTLSTEDARKQLKSYKELCIHPSSEFDGGSISIPLMLAKGNKESFESFNLNYVKGFVPTESELYKQVKDYITEIKKIILETFKYRVSELNQLLTIDFIQSFKIYERKQKFSDSNNTYDFVSIVGELRIARGNLDCSGNVPSEEDFNQIAEILKSKTYPLSFF